MTTDQLQHYVDEALKQRDHFNLVFFPLVILLNLGGAWLISYLREKGKNLATKEDIAVITRAVESVKTDLATKQHFNQVRYERELAVYEKLWPKLCELQAAALSLRPVIDFGPSAGSPEAEEETKRRKKEYLEAHSSVFSAIRHSRPFYPASVWEELNKLVKLCWGEAVEWGLFSNPLLMQERGRRQKVIGKKP